MTIDALLGRLDNVRPRGTGKWSSKCPAHEDRSPSLSIAEGERGILLHCWAGCTIEQVCTALDIRMTDLFVDAGRPDPERLRQRDQERQRRQCQQEQDGLVIDSLREAQRYIHSRRGIDIDGWSDEHLAAELDALADAYEIMGNHRGHE